MRGIAEDRDGLSRKLVSALRIGEEYSLDDFARLLGQERNAVTRKGVLTKKGSDAQILLITLEKDQYSTPGYVDHLEGTTLFWTGQNSIKSVEKNLLNGTHDTFIFLQERRKTPYVYYGRAVHTRVLLSWEPGKPSHVVFELVEYAEAHAAKRVEAGILQEREPAYGLIAAGPTDRQLLTKVRTAQTEYRKGVLSLWDGRCAVTQVDDQGWLIASHIKPWREADDRERVVPHNSLLLTPNYDKLFDRGVISFAPDTGKIILPEIQTQQMWNNLTRLHIDDTVHLRCVPDGVGKYLRYHNNYIYGFSPNDKLSSDDFLEEIVVKGLA